MKNFKKLLLLISVVFLSNQKLHAQAGTLDPTFGDGGVVIYDTVSSSDASILQPDGKIVLLSANFAYTVVSRFNMDGSFDPTFGINGRAYFRYNGNVYNYVQNIVIQNDGKLIFTSNYHSDSKIDIAILRCNSDGKPDSSFGTNGLETIEMDNLNIVHGLVIQPDGKIAVSGDVRKSQYDEKRTFLFRLMPNGGLDTGFGDEGIVITQYGNATNNEGLVIRPDGKLVKGNTFDVYDDHSSFQLESFNPDGSVDESFGKNGVAKYIFGEGQGGIWNTEMSSIALKDDGKIVCIGTSGKGEEISMALCCFNADGSVDEGFGDGGGVITSYPAPQYIQLESLDIQQDGKIVVSGYGGAYPIPAVLARYTAIGQLDPEFGDGGITLTVVDSGSDGKTVHILPDGKILVTGGAGHSNIMLLRFNGDNVLAANFKEVKATQTNEAITITWQTLNESGTKSFTVERSSNANDYVGINTVPAKGVASTYNYTDKNPLSGTSYYRIRENAANGTNTFSPVVKVVFNDNGVISLYPNPAKNTVTVKGLNKNTTATIRITDMNGREISKQNFTQSSSATLNIRALAQGSYFVLVEENGKVTKLRMIKE